MTFNNSKASYQQTIIEYQVYIIIVLLVYIPVVPLTLLTAVQSIANVYASSRSPTVVHIRAIIRPPHRTRREAFSPPRPRRAREAPLRAGRAAGDRTPLEGPPEAMFWDIYVNLRPKRIWQRAF